MSTFIQLIKHNRQQRKKKTKYYLFQGRPQKSVKCLSGLEIMTPRKPNSAKRKYVKVGWFQSRGFFFVRQQVGTNAYVTGQLHENPEFYPKKNSDLLIRGGPVKDLPGMKYKIVRGHRKSLKGLVWRKSSRSKFGAKRLYPQDDYHNFFKYKDFKYY